VVEMTQQAPGGQSPPPTLRPRPPRAGWGGRPSPRPAGSAR